MKFIRNYLWVFILFVFIASIFFYKSLLNGYIPFPGDLLVGEYAPYNSYNFLGYAPGGYPNKGQDSDVLRLLYPEKELSIRMFKNFEFPLWNPYNFAGNPHIGSLQSGSFYPLNLLFFFLPFASAWTIFIMMQPILTALFSYLFARELKLSIKSSIFSALVFVFSSYSIVWLEYGNIGHSIAWMPFAMWLTMKNLQKFSLLKSILISVSLTFSILAGYIQTSFYVFLFLGAFIVFHIFFINKKNKAKKLLLFFIIFILAILLSAIQLIPMFELIFQSARFPYTPTEFLNLLIPTFHIVSVFVPDFFGNPATRNYWISGTYIERVTYIGVIPLIFVFYSFLQKQRAIFWFFAISAFCVLLISFDTIVARAIYSLQMPLISTAVPTRVLFLFCFSVSMIAGFGLDSFLKNQNKKLFLKVAGILGSIYLLSWIFVFIAPIIGKNLSLSWVSNLYISKRNLVLPTGLFMAGAFLVYVSFYIKRYKNAIFIFILLLTLVDLFYFFQKITPFTPKETVYPRTKVIDKLRSIQGINRSWGYGSGYISANIQTYEKLFSPDGYNALHIKRYGEFLSSSKDGKIQPIIPRSDPIIVSPHKEEDLRENTYRKRILDLLGVKYILNRSALLGVKKQLDYKIFPEQKYKLIWQENSWQIYENLNVLPRVFLASDYVVERNEDKIVEMIFDDKFSLRDKIILEEDIYPKINFAKDENAKVEIKKYAPNEIVLQTDSRTNMLLFISDNYYKGWKVSIDGENDKIYRADYSFRAVPVPAGQHEVRFSYKPTSFKIGLVISVISFLSMLIFVLSFLIGGKRSRHAEK